MTPAQTVVSHCAQTMRKLSVERRVILLRSIALEIGDPALSERCRALADEHEAADRNLEQLVADIRLNPQPAA